MSLDFCPGAKSLREPTPEFVTCEACGAEVEIWTDEFKVRCPSCGGTVLKGRLPSCVDWCQHAEDCVGSDAYRRLKNMVDRLDKITG